MVKDTELTDASMKKMCKAIQISHDFGKESKSVVDGINVQLFENNKVKDYVKLTGKRKSVVLVKEDGIFNPVYVKYDGEKHGMFKPENNILEKVDL